MPPSMCGMIWAMVLLSWLGFWYGRRSAAKRPSCTPVKLALLRSVAEIPAKGDGAREDRGESRARLARARRLGRDSSAEGLRARPWPRRGPPRRGCDDGVRGHSPLTIRGRSRSDLLARRPGGGGSAGLGGPKLRGAVGVRAGFLGETSGFLGETFGARATGAAAAALADSAGAEATAAVAFGVWVAVGAGSFFSLSSSE